MMRISFQKDKILFLLIITDIVFIILHILFLSTNLLDSPRFLLTMDLGFAEFFQYMKELWIAILFLVLGIKYRKGLFLIFSLLFFYLLLDDSLSIHERLGKYLAEIFRFQAVLGLRPRDLGELLVMAVFGILFFTVFILFYFLSNQKSRQIILMMLGMIILLTGFGVLADMIEIMIKDETISQIIAIIEDGGEMIIMSIITWFVLRLDLDLNDLPFKWVSNREKATDQ